MGGNLGRGHLTDGQRGNKPPPPSSGIFSSLLYLVLYHQSLLYLVLVCMDYNWVKTVVQVLLLTENNERKKVQLLNDRYDYKAARGKHTILKLLDKP